MNRSERLTPTVSDVRCAPSRGTGDLDRCGEGDRSAGEVRAADTAALTSSTSTCSTKESTAIAGHASDGLAYGKPTPQHVRTHSHGHRQATRAVGLRGPERCLQRHPRQPSHDHTRHFAAPSYHMPASETLPPHRTYRRFVPPPLWGRPLEGLHVEGEGCLAPALLPVPVLDPLQARQVQLKG